MRNENIEKHSSYILQDGQLIEAQGGDVAVMIHGTQAELNTLSGLLGPGAIAYTAGWGQSWQLDLDGVTWVAMV